MALTTQQQTKLNKKWAIHYLSLAKIAVQLGGNPTPYVKEAQKLVKGEKASKAIKTFLEHTAWGRNVQAYIALDEAIAATRHARKF
jgi:hypothetical protein